MENLQRRPRRLSVLETLHNAQDLTAASIEVEKRVKQLHGKLRDEMFRQNKIHEKLCTEERVLFLHEDQPTSSQHIVISTTKNHKSPRRKMSSGTVAGSLPKLPVRGDTPGTKKWTKKYLVERGDWDEDVQVQVTCIDVNRPHSVKKTPREQYAAVKLQRWYRSICRVARLTSSVNSVVTLNRISRPSKPCSISLSAEETIKMIEAEVENDFLRRKQHEAAYKIQQCYKNYVGRVDSADGDAISRLLRRRAIRKERTLQMLEEEKAAIRIQAIHRGRMRRKTNRLSVGIVRAQLQQVLQCESELSYDPQNFGTIIKLSRKYDELSTVKQYESQRYVMLRMSALLAQNALLLGYVPENGNFWIRVARAYFAIWEYEEGGDLYILKQCAKAYDHAAEYFEFSIQVQVWIEHAQVLYAQGLFCSAIKKFEKYLAARPNDPKETEITLNIANCCFHLCNYSECIKLLQQIADSQVRHRVYSAADFLMLIARCYEIQHEDQEALTYYTRALHSTYDDQYILRNELTVSKWKKNHRLWFTLAKKLRDTKHYPLAVDFFQSAIDCFDSTKPNYQRDLDSPYPPPEYFAVSAHCFHLFFHEQDAIQMLQKGINYAPQNKLIQQVGRRIYGARESPFEKELQKPITKLREHLQILL